MTDKSVTDKSVRQRLRSTAAPAQEPAAEPRRRPEAIELWTMPGPSRSSSSCSPWWRSSGRPSSVGVDWPSWPPRRRPFCWSDSVSAMVLHVGSIDLSNAAIALFGAILLAKSIGSMGAGAIVLVIVVCSLIGALERIPDRVLPGSELRVDARHPRPAAGRIADHQQRDHGVRHRTRNW